MKGNVQTDLKVVIYTSGTRVGIQKAADPLPEGAEVFAYIVLEQTIEVDEGRLVVDTVCRFADEMAPIIEQTVSSNSPVTPE